MSTVVDNNSTKRRRVSSAEMRDRVLSAAGMAFSRAGYDAVGIREIATAAGTDPAIVIRLFGSKAALFTELAERAFGSEDVFAGPLATLGTRLAEHLMQPIEDALEREDNIDDLELLLRSATSLIAAPILSEALHKALTGPLGERIGGDDGAVRAALLIAQVMGLAILRVSLGSAVLEAAERATVIALYGRALQSCLDDPTGAKG